MAMFMVQRYKKVRKEMSLEQKKHYFMQKKTAKRADWHDICCRLLKILHIMLYNDKYDKTEERMLDVINSVHELSEDRFIASLYIRNVSPLDVDIRLAETRRCLSIVNGEMLRLAKYELTYNNDFAVDDNQRFTTAERLFNRLRSTMASIRKKIRQGCPIVHKQPRDPMFKPSTFERSVLTKGCCGRDLYGIASFDDNVQALFYEQQALFANVILSLTICYRVIKEEKEIMANPERSMERFHDQCQRLLKDMEDIFDVTKDIEESEIQKKIEEMGLREYCKNYFHKPSVKELKRYVFNMAKRKEECDELSQMSTIAFRDEAKRQDAILLLVHFDELCPDRRKMINALSIRLWCNWCDGGKVDNPKEIYYKMLLKGYRGEKLEFPQWHAITQSKSRLNGRDIMDVQREFNVKAEEIIKKYRPNPAGKAV